MGVRLARLAGRADIPLRLNAKGLKGLAVEVGTHRGEYAKAFLEKWKGKTLYCVDPWIRGYDRFDPASQGNREEDERTAREVLAPFGSRCVIVKKTSVEAAERFAPNSLDFVYIDGCHQPAHVKQDFYTWWPLLRVGGYLAGHDVYTPNDPGKGWDQYVKPMARQWARRHGVHLHLVAEIPARAWSFYIIKPKTKRKRIKRGTGE